VKIGFFTRMEYSTFRRQLFCYSQWLEVFNSW